MTTEGELFGRNDAAVERVLATGLKNRWWCIGPSSMVEDTPVGLKRLGQKLVAWRDHDGTVNLLDDWCPHRGAPLSRGRLENGKLACRYHGVEVDGTGTVTSVPAFPRCDLIGQRLVKRWHVVEHFQGLWVWFGDDDHLDPPELDFPDEFTSPEWTGFPMSDTWQCNYQYVWDNLLDIMHPEYLHRDTQYFETGSANEVTVTPTESGFTVQRKIYEGDNVEKMEFIDNGCIWFRIGFYAPPSCGPGGNWRVFPFPTPIDENSCQMTIWRMRNVSGWEGALHRFMFNTRLEPYNWAIVEEDRDMLEDMPSWPVPENLYQHDIGLARLRRHVRKEAAAQIAARRQGETSDTGPAVEN